MLRTLIAVPLLALALDAPPLPAQAEPYRPVYYFTPTRNWMNDPNGARVGRWGVASLLSVQSVRPAGSKREEGCPTRST
jgi:hypothetical protein